MNASTKLNRIDSRTDAGGAPTKRRRNAPSRPRPGEIGKESTGLEAQINSLKVLALTLLREVENLEAPDATGTVDALDLSAAVHRFEAELIRSALIRTGGRQRPAARLLGMKATTLNAKIKRYRIEPKEANAVKIKSNVKSGEGNGFDPHGNPTP